MSLWWLTPAGERVLREENEELDRQWAAEQYARQAAERQTEPLERIVNDLSEKVAWLEERLAALEAKSEPPQAER